MMDVFSGFMWQYLCEQPLPDLSSHQNTDKYDIHVCFLDRMSRFDRV